MDFASAILAVLLTLPPPYVSTETAAEYRTRMQTIASAVDAETKDVRGWHLGQTQLAAIVLTIFWTESRFDPVVHAGGIHRVWSQDRAAARCLGQLHASGLVPTPEWSQLAGTDIGATRRCTAATVRVFLAHWRRCVPSGQSASRGNVARALTGYGHGGSCTAAPWSIARARTVETLLRRLRDPPAIAEI